MRLYYLTISSGVGRVGAGEVLHHLNKTCKMELDLELEPGLGKGSLSCNGSLFCNVASSGDPFSVSRECRELVYDLFRVQLVSFAKSREKASKSTVPQKIEKKKTHIQLPSKMILPSLLPPNPAFSSATSNSTAAIPT